MARAMGREMVILAKTAMGKVIPNMAMDWEKDMVVVVKKNHQLASVARGQPGARALVLVEEAAKGVHAVALEVVPALLLMKIRIAIRALAVVVQ